ncbi:hypothetical protein OHA61_23200 [Streptomyces sp. NBC_00885]|uniref:hypothetical protein n=1 Tax=Streptomyces sp. NBC_00885 TaxID=2975857 RepID=UPI00386BC48A|nr:hypothetical protein OHA61_23200 [Streptomyces sp. NBC_00885]
MLISHWAARQLLPRRRPYRAPASAVGLWTKASLPLHEAWVSRLPTDTRGVLSGDRTADRSALDAWVEKRTGGLIRSMPTLLDRTPNWCS